MAEQFVISTNQVEKGVKTLLEVLKATEKQRDSLFGGSKWVNLQFATKKVQSKEKTVKLKLPNGLECQHKEVCLFVKDLDKTDREYEKSVRHFKTFLKSRGVTCVSEIIPLKALKLEHKPFEAKRNLSNRFDIFLADARIIRLLPSYLGKAFFSRKRQPVQVRMDAKDLKGEFEAAVNNSRCVMSGKGSVGMARVGSTSMSEAELVQNIIASAQQIGIALPGGGKNLRNIYIKTEDSMAIPIYVSSGSANDVQLPKTERKKEVVEAEDITTVENGLVKVLPYGVVKIIDEHGKCVADSRKTRKRAVKHKGKLTKESRKPLKQHKELKGAGKQKVKKMKSTRPLKQPKSVKREGGKNTEEAKMPRKKRRT